MLEARSYIRRGTSFKTSINSYLETNTLGLTCLIPILILSDYLLSVPCRLSRSTERLTYNKDQTREKSKLSLKKKTIQPF